MTCSNTSSKYDILTTMPTEVMSEVETSKLDDTLTEIQIKYHTCLWRGVPKGKHVNRYDCHCIGVPQRVVGCTCLRKGSKHSKCSVISE